jgi:two-component system sensor histidine kinase PhoQ
MTADGNAGSEPPGTQDRKNRPLSLRLSMSMIASVVLVLALGLVWFALTSANHQSAVSALQARMESYVYLVLAAAEIDEQGDFLIAQDISDPSLNQPGSGIYVHVDWSKDHWNSSSSLGVVLPELVAVQAGEIIFSEPIDEVDFYTYQYGVDWQLETNGVIPLMVSVLVARSEIEQQTNAFQLGLWRALGTAGAILLMAQLLMIFLSFRSLQVVARDVARVESGQAPRLQGSYPSELEPLARNVNQLLDTEKANQLRYRNALDSLAHSLKTPLAIIQSGLEGDTSGSKKAMRQAIREMNQLVSTRLQRAAVSARRTMSQPIEVKKELERVLSGLHKVHSQKMISTDVIISPGLQFFGEQRDLLELVGNLLDNAFKYGEKQVRLNAGPLDRTAIRTGMWLRVEDDGQGIDAKDWPSLLKRGVRGDERVDGHGLGLSIVLELVSAYGGKIDIGHSALGGAMIYVEFPGS